MPLLWEHDAHLPAGVIALAREAMNGEMSAGTLAQIVTETMRAAGRASGDQTLAASQTGTVAELIMEAEGGIVTAMTTVSALLSLAATGGYTASGEVRATAMETAN